MNVLFHIHNLSIVRDSSSPAEFETTVELTGYFYFTQYAIKTFDIPPK